MAKRSNTWVEAKVYFTADLDKEISLFEYAQKNTDQRIKEAVKPIMNDSRTLAARLVRQGVRNPHSRYSWKLYNKSNGTWRRANGRYAKALTVRDHSVTNDVFYEVTGAKNEYRLSHLLEHSHKVQPWGNKNAQPKMTREVVHMKPAQDLVDDKAPKACEKVLDKLFG